MAFLRHPGFMSITANYLTTTVPLIHGCTLHKYGYDPGFSNVTVKLVSGGPGGAFLYIISLYMSEREKELDAMTNFMYSLRAAESRRQYPARLKLNLAFGSFRFQYT